MIVSPQNQRLKAARLLIQGRGRPQTSARVAKLIHGDLAGLGLSDSAELMVLEGPNPISAALDAGVAMPLVLATATFINSNHPILSRVRPVAVEDSLLNALADADSPRGLIAIVAATPDHDLAPCDSSWSTVLYLDQIRNPGNVGAILRVAEATGIDLVVLSRGCVSWRHPRALRASAGSALRVRLAEGHSAASLGEALSAAQLDPSEPWKWYGLAAGGVSLFDTPLATQRVLAVGSEAHGLSPETRERCTATLALPMEGEVESLNAATAVAVALFEIQRRAPSMEIQLP